MNLTEAKQLLSKNGYDIINEAGLGWDEGYEQLNPTEQKAAD